MEGQTDLKLDEAPRRLLRFDGFVVDPDDRLLRRGDVPVQLTPKVFAVLLALLEKPGRVVPKEELIGKVWPDTFVSDANLTQSISALRKALGETAQDRRYVVTIPGAGYSFVAPVEALAEGEDRVPPEEPATEDVAAPGPELFPKGRWRQFTVLAAALVLAAASAWILLDRSGRFPSRKEPAPGSPGNRLSVAILGFRNLSARGEAQWLSTALPEMLTSELAAVKQVRLIPAESVARVRLPQDVTELDRADLKRIEKTLGSDLLVAGSFLKLSQGGGGRLRLDVRVLRLPGGEPLISLAETGTESELFELVSRTSGRLREALGVAELTPQQARAARALLPTSREAARLYTEGLARLGAFDAAGARDLLERAARADAASAVVRSALSQAWADLGEDAKAVRAAQ
ncbi:MAG TPA: winged helix-turn-helix domain-containing protein, partial [Thermoanaerobaculia bacterium]|nr:winged helix-turn-helix domain-containing protein [Thermoanaerobaculia bacterium]